MRGPRRLELGIGLMSFAVLLLELLLTRIFSALAVVLWLAGDRGLAPAPTRARS